MLPELFAIMYGILNAPCGLEEKDRYCHGVDARPRNCLNKGCEKRHKPSCPIQILCSEVCSHSFEKAKEVCGDFLQIRQKFEVEFLQSGMKQRPPARKRYRQAHKDELNSRRRSKRDREKKRVLSALADWESG